MEFLLITAPHLCIIFSRDVSVRAFCAKSATEIVLPILTSGFRAAKLVCLLQFLASLRNCISSIFKNCNFWKY